MDRLTATRPVTDDGDDSPTTAGPPLAPADDPAAAVASSTIDLSSLTTRPADLDVDLDRTSPEPDALGQLSRTTVRRLRVLPLHLHDGHLQVAVVTAAATAGDPGDAPDTHQLAERLRTEAGMPVRLLQADPAALAQAIHQAYPPVDDIARLLDREPDEHTASRTLQLLLVQAVGDRASDIHLEPRADGLDVRMRVDGRLRQVVTLPPTLQSGLISRIKVLADLNILEHRRYQDGHLQAAVDGTEFDLRVSVAPTTDGEKVVLRLLDRTWARLPLSRLGMADDVHAAVREAVDTPHGMLLCAGPTGAGKTTTLYATVAEVADAEVNVTTIEDPVEYSLSEINQIQVDESAGVDFARGLRGILRQDPDVILVGEVRDTDTAATAVQASLSGHLVLSSFHATDAAGALQRMVDMGIDPATVATAVRAVLAQRLVRRVCSGCAEQAPTTDEQRAVLAQLAPSLPAPDTLAHGTGCIRCAGTGFRGQVGVFELLRVTPAVHDRLAEGATRAQLHDLAVSQGMRPMTDAVAAMVAEGTTTLSEAIRQVGLPDTTGDSPAASARCRGTTRQGRRCRNQASEGPYCRTHVPAEPLDDPTPETADDTDTSAREDA